MRLELAVRISFLSVKVQLKKKKKLHKDRQTIPKRHKTTIKKHKNPTDFMSLVVLYRSGEGIFTCEVHAWIQISRKKPD